MSAFTFETVLDTKNPFSLELLGAPSATVRHQLTGTMHLHVQKPVQFKLISIAFVGEAYLTYTTNVVSVKSDAVQLCRSEHNVVDAPTTYQPGEYSFPFTLTVPGDLATTDSSKLKAGTFFWGYDLITCAIPMGLFSRRKVSRQTIKVKRVTVQPSETADVRFGAKRAGEFECSLYAPKVVNTAQNAVHASIYLHPFSPKHKVKDVQAIVIQTEKVKFDSRVIEDSVGGIRSFMPSPMDIDPLNRKSMEREPLVKSDDAKPISKTVTVPNPDQESFTTAWGREFPVELEIDLIPGELLPSEELAWISVAHGIRFTINFADPSVKPLNVMAPFTAANILDELWSLQASHDGITPPDYGEEVDHSMLLDSNTSRVASATIHRDIYPEREPVVPDLADDLPPNYDNEEECPVPYEKEVSSSS
ncbi:hypothetical protein CPC16_010556 [Podila verticillata]|nr:hypothetical protein BGZ52_007244 [Haplosporangium bisporale]KAF9201251.1 hypothetical protein BGZ59_002829 [Podila verticillata]KAF9379860.1 hypothetical protein CPC16_010556 [Podila verticillata]KAI9235558.1 MAG: hypothetical protein BYD32DRAFT_52628 [Podila humilis]KFH64174.1 hypothetical protein MVEG_09999 [Podila verticillata NRRL 6337]